MTAPVPASTPGVVHLAVWSGPRNVSTALMRSWENRGDTEVLDEPLYAHYLAHTGLDHPGRDEVIAAGAADWRQAVARCCEPPAGDATISYQKHMAHHLLPHIERDWLAGFAHCLLIRDPERVLASYARVRSAVTLDDIGLPQQLELLHDLPALTGRPPLVLDATDVLGDPATSLERLCAHAGVPFTPRMLRWPPGPRASDGVWAPHWYDGVWRSTRFSPPDDAPVTVPAHLRHLVAPALACYEELRAARSSS